MKRLKIILTVIAIISISLCAVTKAVSMEINNPPYSINYVKEVNGALIYPKIIPIGSWDMDTIDTLTVPHGIPNGTLKIISVTGIINNDALNDARFIEMLGIELSAITSDCVILDFTNTNIVLFRRTGGLYDSISYNDPGVDRGRLLVWFST